jgi:hypothetical protein
MCGDIFWQLTETVAGLWGALNLVCGIMINSERLTGAAKWEEMLKLYEIDKQNVLYHLLPNVMHRHLNPV